MVIRYRYTEWDGTQEIPPLDPDDILNALTDDLMNFGDLQHALRNLLQRGMRDQQGQRMQGLRDLLQQLRQQRRSTLDRFNLSSVFDDIQKKLEEILDKERGTLEERLKDALGNPPAGSEDGEPAEGSESGEPGDGQDGGDQSDQRGQQQGGQRGQQTGQSGQQSGGRGEGGKGNSQSGSDANEQQFAEMLKNIVERKRNFLEGLPEDLGGQMKELQNYEFMDPEAQAEFQELMEMLKKAMMDTFFKDMQNQIANMSPEDMERMKNMIRDLNKMLQEKMAGGEPNF